MIHSDICGPLNLPTYFKCQYFLTFIDDKTQYVTIYLLKHKNEMLDKFKQYKEYVETKTNKRTKMLRFDNGGEYKSNDFIKFC